MQFLYINMISYRLIKSLTLWLFKSKTTRNLSRFFCGCQLMVSQVSVMSQGPRIVDTVNEWAQSSQKCNTANFEAYCKGDHDSVLMAKEQIDQWFSTQSKIDPLDIATHSWQQNKSYWVEKGQHVQQTGLGIYIQAPHRNELWIRELSVKPDCVAS